MKFILSLHFHWLNFSLSSAGRRPDENEGDDENEDDDEEDQEDD